MNKRFSKAIEPRFRLCFIMLFVFAAASFYFANVYVASAELVICVAVYLIFRLAASHRAKELTRYVEDTMADVNRANKESTLNFPMATAVIRLDTKEIIWGNPAFEDMVGNQTTFFEQHLFDLIPEFDITWVLEGKTERPEEMEINGKIYRVYGSVLRNDESGGVNILLTLHWLDVTDYSTTIAEYEASSQIVSVIMIDNYEEIMKGLNDAERSAIIAETDSRIAEWVRPSNGVFLRYERDKFLYIFEKRFLESYTENKFSILDSVREITSKNGVKVTLSIGIGMNGENFKENHRSARLAIDMALSRGGDQAVIRNKFNFEFFGGRSQELEKQTKVKSRVMANALEALIRDSSGVLIMGHKVPDNDCIGAAVGIACIARKMKKTASIVLGGGKTSADALIQKLRGDELYSGLFISEEDAIIEADSSTLVVVVDTNRVSMVESETLLESANKIAVIDHHRRGAEYIKDAVLNFHEPYASSTCELVTELLQYIVETRDIARSDAEAILSGIVIDTKRFTMKTGVRTFEAAAYLRRAGADTVELKRIVQDDLANYVKRAEMVKLARMYHDSVAIVEYNDTSTRLTAAQAADELLSIRGVNASFVLYREQDNINISARSLGDINVQIILEKLGGGGHFETAGVQIKNKNMQEVSAELMSAIDSVLG